MFPLLKQGSPTKPNADDVFVEVQFTEATTPSNNITRTINLGMSREKYQGDGTRSSGESSNKGWVVKENNLDYHEHICPVVSEMMHDAPPGALKAGWLTKQGGVRKNWLKRYFVLTSETLEYKKDPHDNLPISKISLCNYSVSDALSETGRQNCLKLVPTDPSVTSRTYFMFCENAESFQEWVTAIKEAISLCVPPVVASPPSNASSPGLLSTSTILHPKEIVESDQHYEIVYAMLNGIRYSIGRVSALIDCSIDVKDFTHVEKFSVNKQTHSAAHPGSHISYKFSDYFPKVFRRIRENFSIQGADYMLSLTAHYRLSELKTPGKSASFFYYSSDKRYLIKTISRIEGHTLRAMIHNYYLHISQNNNTLLLRVLGLHKISTPNVKKTYFVVLGNIFSDKEIHETYDLKGSTIGRIAEPGATVLKDLDFMGKNIYMGNERRSLFLKQVEVDSKFLERNNVMDYSLLLGIHYPLGHPPEEFYIPVSPDNNSNNNNNNHNSTALNTSFLLSNPNIFQSDSGGFQATTHTNELYPIIYYLGIIDIFTPYNITKQLEHSYKSRVFETKDAISVVDSQTYANRFRQFLAKVTGWNNNNSFNLTPPQ
eukprot:TRINITY_DN6331_c0_g1_i1.p1 TRINITY_DN6331_c0_g1~~TRINITY_DN6331_c0_g1_i1.p1  ORF type:complete len:600 (-),score=98.84 TRINITY_DN6331_c0_g1_i1:70-1869(-)